MSTKTPTWILTAVVLLSLLSSQAASAQDAAGCSCVEAGNWKVTSASFKGTCQTSMGTIPIPEMRRKVKQTVSLQPAEGCHAVMMSAAAPDGRESGEVLMSRQDDTCEYRALVDASVRTFNDTEIYSKIWFLSAGGLDESDAFRGCKDYTMDSRLDVSKPGQATLFIKTDIDCFAGDPDPKRGPAIDNCAIWFSADLVKAKK